MKVAVIGSGFAGLATAAYLGKQGHEVTVLEKNSEIGGRARQFNANGYKFDMGPSWYWMPDIIEGFFNDFGYSASDFYELVSLDPQFEMVFEDGQLAVPKDMEEIGQVFEQLEPGAKKQLNKFMKAAKYKYQVGMKDFVNKPCHSWTEFFSPKIFKSALKLNLLSNFRNYVQRFFKHPWLVSLMEFPVIFLGSSPKDIPAMYSLMNYGGYALGTWYPKGGFVEIINAMAQVAKKQGVKILCGQPVSQIITTQTKATGVIVNKRFLPFDAVVASSDYEHTEHLLQPEYRNYTDNYWEQKTFAPSCLLFYLGIEGEIKGLKHHTLFFEHDLDQHTKEIYQDKKWPTKPLFYVCCPSKTDKGVAPVGNENLFLLMPIATGISEQPQLYDGYLQDMLQRIEKYTGTKNLLQRIDYKRTYCVADFIADYNAYKGNAYGLANTLNQTAVLKPALRNKKISNLFYAGQLTVPGPGVPPAIISGKIAATEVNRLKP